MRTCREVHRKILIAGHRNPDVDSVMSAYALAELKRRLGDDAVQAICPGLMPNRAAWIFDHFHLQPPPCVNDVYVRIGDLAREPPARLTADTPLFEAVQRLKSAGAAALPVVDVAGRHLGMLSPLALLAELMNIASHKDQSLAGRAVYTAPALMCRVLEAECLTGEPEEAARVFNVFVAAMRLETFEARILRPERDNPVVIVGDRPEIHRCVLEHRIPVLILTGNAEMEPGALDLARTRKTVVLRTRFDSATVIRRIKFSTPVSHVPLIGADAALHEGDRVHDVRRALLASPENLFPVCDADGRLVGVVEKNDFNAPPPFAVILVDHNEPAQGIPGLEELPILEVVDHHRIAIRPTSEPIKYTSDVVGSTCTIVAGMFRTAGLRPSRKIAGVLLAGLVTDTLLFQSPTTTETDRTMAAWLSKISGEAPEALMDALMKLDSPLAVMPVADALESDRKLYAEHGYRFALSQIEETNFELLHRKREALAEAMRRSITADALDFMALMVTDPVRGNSEMLFVGDEAIRRAVPFVRRDNGLFALPGIISRKKQLLPQMLATLAAFQTDRNSPLTDGRGIY